MDLGTILNEIVANGTSDILIVASQMPRARKSGALLEQSEYGEIPAEIIDEFRVSLIGSEGESDYIRTGGFDTSYSLENQSRCRINFFTTIHGPGMAVRPIRSGGVIDFRNCGLPDTLADLCSAGRGMILVTGATGSGKTTTLSAMVNYINQNFSKHILMIEDPTEYIHTNKMSMVNQREINSSEQGSFLQALKFALRENPDVIVIGEIRDAETMQTALNASMTGHLVMATLHTTDTIQTIERMLGLFPEHMRDQAAQDISMAINAVISQRLLPRQDNNGMLPALEILIGTATVRKQIAERDLNALELTLRSGIHQGMITFNRALLNLYKEGSISFETAIGATSNPDEFKLMIRGVENGGTALIQRYGSGNNDGNFSDFEQIDMKTLLRSAVRNKASDLILSVGVPPMVKLDGELCKLDLPSLGPEDLERLIFSIVTRNQRVILEEQKELDFALAVNLPRVISGEDETICRFRLNAFYQRGTLGLVARVINSRIPDPQTLNLPPVLSQLVQKRQGLILVTGPTGSGKSTTLASLIDQVNRSKSCHIVTIEDPVEYVYENHMAVIEQREVNADTLGFSAALRSAMREAPDVILLGEMRDTETISAALTAAETGHLVLATLHTNSASQTVDRVVDSFPANQQNQVRQQLAATLLGVVSQRLIPKVSGRGMVAAFEIMVGTPPIQALIRENKTHLLQSTLETSFKDGMVTMEKSLEELYTSGQISAEETRRFMADYHKVQSF